MMFAGEQKLENRDPINLKLLRRVLKPVFVVCFIFYVCGSLILAYLYPWKPPLSDEGVDGSVLRVVVPEDATYAISFGGFESGQRSRHGPGRRVRPL